jgi:hypothetical protein
MKNIHKDKPLKIRLLQPSASKRTYQLIEYEDAEGEPIGSLTWEKRWGSLAIADSATGRWTFKRQGFLRPVVTARKITEPDKDFARFHFNLGGSGTLILRDIKQQTFKWSRKGILRPEFQLTSTEKGKKTNLLAQFKPYSKITKLEADIKLEQEAFLIKELDLLILIGAYLLVLMRYDDEEAAAAGAATAAIAAGSS